jgi:hypothetical protein
MALITENDLTTAMSGHVRKKITMPGREKEVQPARMNQVQLNIDFPAWNYRNSSNFSTQDLPHNT